MEKSLSERMDIMMNNIKGYLNLSNGQKQEHHVKLTEKLEEGVRAIYIDGFARGTLNSEFGAGIEIQVNDAKRWMADYRHSEFWCRPEFGTCLSDIPDETQGLIYEKEDGSFGVILPVVSEQYKCVLAGAKAEEGKDVVLAKLFSWYEGMTSCKGLGIIDRKSHV